MKNRSFIYQYVVEIEILPVVCSHCSKTLCCVCMCMWNSAETENVLHKVQEFITSLSNFTDCENQRLMEEVSTKLSMEVYTFF